VAKAVKWATKTDVLVAVSKKIILLSVSVTDDEVTKSKPQL